MQAVGFEYSILFVFRVFSRLSTSRHSRKLPSMLSSLELVLSLDDADETDKQKAQAATLLSVSPDEISEIRVRRRSLDARRAPIRLRLLCDVWTNENAPLAEKPVQIEYSKRDVRPEKTVVIVGCGPAGTFAALELLRHGIRPIILERGKDVQSRRRDLAQLTRNGVVNENSNYCFGEGGAGTFSDGKLYTRVKDKNSIRHTLQTLVAHGAPEEILVEAHPHIGSNRLPKVVQKMRETIVSNGGEIRFNSRVVDFLISNGRMRGVVLENGEEVVGKAVILASGHSGREIFEILQNHRVLVTPKPFALGVRIEHPQPLIDAIQYRHAKFEKKDNGEWRHPKLPAASYRLAHEVEGRGVFSFCMCPGGWIVPSATKGDEVVVNGMSLSRRDSPFANSGLVVSVETEDLKEYEKHGAIAGVRLQRELETRAQTLAGNADANGQVAPAQRVVDFLKDRVSISLPPCSYKPGISSVSMNEVLPESVARRLRTGLEHFGRQMRGYVSEDALLIGVETRTSSPVRVPRDETSRQHPEIAGLFPCGEGAGYAGGIVSAAIDGTNSAKSCVANIEYSTRYEKFTAENTKGAEVLKRKDGF